MQRLHGLQLQMMKQKSMYTQLSGIVDFVKELQEVDTSEVEPMTHPLQVFNVLRKDVPTDILDREEMLKSVKEHEDGQIKVPTIL